MNKEEFKIMEKRIQEIINNGIETVERYENIVTNLSNKIEFCKLHKFLEEERITRVKLESVEMIVYRYRLMLNQLQETLNTEKS